MHACRMLLRDRPVNDLGCPPEPSRLLAWGLLIDAHLRDPRCELPLAPSPSLREDFRAVSEKVTFRNYCEKDESRVQKGVPYFGAT
jgi:hypothetical protein